MLESWLFREREKIFDLIGQEDLKKIQTRKHALIQISIFSKFNKIKLKLQLYSNVSTLSIEKNNFYFVIILQFSVELKR